MSTVHHLIVKLLKNTSDEESVYEYYEGIVMVGGGGGLRSNLKIKKKTKKNCEAS